VVIFMHLLEFFLLEYLYTVMAYVPAGRINKIFVFKMFQIMM